jgi:hypothetical protein
MDAHLIIVLSELLAVVGDEGVQTYLKHRKNMIKNGRENELISYKARKLSDKIINVVRRASSPALRYEDAYPQEVEIEIAKARTSFTKRLKSLSLRNPLMLFKRNTPLPRRARAISKIEEEPKEEEPKEEEPKVMLKPQDFSRRGRQVLYKKYLDENTKF